MSKAGVYLGMDDGNLRAYRPIPLVTEQARPGLSNALCVYGVAFYLGKNVRPEGLLFLDLNPHKAARAIKQSYRKDVAERILEKIDAIDPEVIWACNYFSSNGPLYYDHPEKKHILHDLEVRRVPIQFGESGPVDKAHECVTEFVMEAGKFIDYRLKKLAGWSRATFETVGSAEEFLSWNNTPIEDGVSGRMFITQQLQEYVKRQYDDKIVPSPHLKGMEYSCFLKKETSGRSQRRSRTPVSN